MRLASVRYYHHQRHYPRQTHHVRDDMSDSPSAGVLLQTNKQGRCQPWTPEARASGARQRQKEAILPSLDVPVLFQ